MSQALGSPAGVRAASPRRLPDTRERAMPMQTSLFSLKAPYALLPDFCPGLSGQEYRHPVLNKKRTVALIHPLSKTEKPPFNYIYHINFRVSIHLQKGKQCAS